MEIKKLIEQVHDIAKEKGWWNGEPCFSIDFPNFISNVHGETSEAWEEFRNGKSCNEIYFSDDNKPEGIPIELADILIRIFDFCGSYKIDLEKALKLKMDFNKTRPFRHGNKKA